MSESTQETIDNLRLVVESRFQSRYNADVMAENACCNDCCSETIAIVGVGLLGGSIAGAVKAHGLARRVLGVGRNPARLQAAQDAGLIDDYFTEVSAASGEADMAIVCTPVDRIADDVRQVASNCRSGTLITDVGSIKGRVCCELSHGLPTDVTFIGSHPLAGSEKTGFEHADARLLSGACCVITPDNETPFGEKERLASFWRGLDMWVAEMSPETHDLVLAQTSHLPHVVAAALAGVLSESNRTFAATGFADTTRIASGDPNLWAAILLANSDAVTEHLDRFAVHLTAFRQAMADQDAYALHKLLQDAKTNRDSLTNIR